VCWTEPRLRLWNEWEKSARTASAGSATAVVDATTAAAPRESAQVRKEVGGDTWWSDSRGSVCQPRAYYDLLDSAVGRGHAPRLCQRCSHGRRARREVLPGGACTTQPWAQPRRLSHPRQRQHGLDATCNAPLPPCF